MKVPLEKNGLGRKPAGGFSRRGEDQSSAGSRIGSFCSPRLPATTHARQISVLPSFILSCTLSLAVDFSAWPLITAQTKVSATPITAL